MFRLLLALACTVAPALQAQALLVTERDSAVHYIGAENVLINGKERLRVAAAGGSYTEKQYNKMAAGKLSQWPSLIRDAATGHLVAPEKQILIPDGAKGPGKTSDAWETASITYSTPGSKARMTLSPGRLLAILQGGAPDELAAAYAGKLANFFDPGGPDAALAAQGRAMAAAAAAFSQSGAVAKIGRDLAASLSTALQMLDSGMAEPAQLQQARLLARTSAAVFGSAPEHKTLRDRLADRESYFLMGRASLAAIYSGQQWDEYLHFYRGLEKYQFLFPEIQKTYRDALLSSKDAHRKRAEARAEVKDFAGAHREYAAALSRDPNDTAIQNSAENMRLSLTRVPRARSRNVDPASPELIVLNRMIADGIRYLKEGDQTSAEREFNNAGRQNSEYPPLLLAKAQWLQAANQLSAALKILDRYDSLVSAEKEWQLGEEIRRDIGFQLKKSRRQRDSQLVKLLNELQFGSALRLAQAGLTADAGDVDLIYRTGLITAMTGDRKTAVTLLGHYLDASNNLSGDAARRREVLRFLGLLQQERPNRLIGRALPAGAQYDPASIAFRTPVERVRGGKWNTAFQWNGGRLESIVYSSEEKLAPPPVVFRFGSGAHGVSRSFQDDPGKPAGAAVAALPKPESTPSTALGSLFGASEPAAPKSESGPVLASDVGSLRKGAGFPILTSAYQSLDLPLIEQMTGLRLGYAVAGNRYFHPFAWQKLHLFQLSYDADGRAVRARAVAVHGETNVPDEILQFRWEGSLLREIGAYPPLATGEPDLTRLSYRRTMQYGNDRLQSEVVETNGRKSKIEYKYDAGRLILADCEEDPALDQRSRNVTFVR